VSFHNPMNSSRPPPSPTAQLIADRLAAYLGPHTARVAVKTFALRALQRGPEELGPCDIPALVDALRPMLRAFVGRERSEAILKQIREEVMS
jgi:hypothetical protein